MSNPTQPEPEPEPEPSLHKQVFGHDIDLHFSSSSDDDSSSKDDSSVQTNTSNKAPVIPVIPHTSVASPPHYSVGNTLAPTILPPTDPSTWTPHFTDLVIQKVDEASTSSTLASLPVSSNSLPSPLELARQLKKGEGGLVLTSQEKVKWTHSSENSAVYEARKARSFSRMLEFMEKFGGPHLKQLATQKVDNGLVEVPLLVDFLRNSGDKQVMLYILDACLKLFVEHAKKVIVKNMILVL
jgi:hypothetical protein